MSGRSILVLLGKGWGFPGIGNALYGSPLNCYGACGYVITCWCVTVVMYRSSRSSGSPLICHLGPCSVTQLCPTPCDLMDWSKPGFPVLYHLPELAQTHVHWVGDTIQPSHPLLPPSPPALNLSWHWGLFQWVGCLQQVAKYWSFSFSISPSNEYSGLISFRIDWFDLLAIQEILKSLFQNQSSKASVLQLYFSWVYAKG